VAISPAYSTHQKQSIRSVDPVRKQPESPRSPLLRHVTTRVHRDTATEEELKCIRELEEEVAKFWRVIETDLDKVEAFYEGKVRQP